MGSKTGSSASIFSKLKSKRKEKNELPDQIIPEKIKEPIDLMGQQQYLFSRIKNRMGMESTIKPMSKYGTLGKSIRTLLKPISGRY